MYSTSISVYLVAQMHISQLTNQNGFSCGRYKKMFYTEREGGTLFEEGTGLESVSQSTKFLC